MSKVLVLTRGKEFMEKHFINYKGIPVSVAGPRLSKGMVTHHTEYDDENPLAHTMIIPRTEHPKIHHTGVKRSPEAIANITEGKRKNPLSPESRWKIGTANRGKKFSDAVKRRIGEAHKGSHHTPETRKKMSESAKERWRKQHAIQ